MSNLSEPVQQQRQGNMSFSQALHLLRRGDMIARAGWNGKGMFLFIRPEFVCGMAAFEKIQSIPEKVKEKIIEKQCGPLGDQPSHYRFTPPPHLDVRCRRLDREWVAGIPDGHAG